MNVIYEFVLASPVVTRVSFSSWMVFEMGGKWPNSCCFGECVLLPEFVQNSSLHFCVVPIELFLNAFC